MPQGVPYAKGSRRFRTVPCIAHANSRVPVSGSVSTRRLGTGGGVGKGTVRGEGGGERTGVLYKGVCIDGSRSGSDPARSVKDEGSVGGGSVSVEGGESSCRGRKRKKKKKGGKGRDVHGYGKGSFRRKKIVVLEDDDYSYRETHKNDWELFISEEENEKELLVGSGEEPRVEEKEKEEDLTVSKGKKVISTDIEDEESEWKSKVIVAEEKSTMPGKKKKKNSSTHSEDMETDIVEKDQGSRLKKRKKEVKAELMAPATNSFKQKVKSLKWKDESKKYVIDKEKCSGTGAGVVEDGVWKGEAQLGSCAPCGELAVADMPDTSLSSGVAEDQEGKSQQELHGGVDEEMQSKVVEKAASVTSNAVVEVSDDEVEEVDGVMPSKNAEIVVSGSGVSEGEKEVEETRPMVKHEEDNCGVVELPSFLLKSCQVQVKGSTAKAVVEDIFNVNVYEYQVEVSDGEPDTVPMAEKGEEIRSACPPTIISSNKDSTTKQKKKQKEKNVSTSLTSMESTSGSENTKSVVQNTSRALLERLYARLGLLSLPNFALDLIFWYVISWEKNFKVRLVCKYFATFCVKKRYVDIIVNSWLDRMLETSLYNRNTPNLNPVGVEEKERLCYHMNGIFRNVVSDEKFRCIKWKHNVAIQFAVMFMHTLASRIRCEYYVPMSREEENIPKKKEEELCGMTTLLANNIYYMVRNAPVVSDSTCRSVLRMKVFTDDAIRWVLSRDEFGVLIDSGHDGESQANEIKFFPMTKGLYRACGANMRSQQMYPYTLGLLFMLRIGVIHSRSADKLAKTPMQSLVGGVRRIVFTSMPEKSTDAVHRAISGRAFAVHGSLVKCLFHGINPGFAEYDEPDFDHDIENAEYKVFTPKGIRYSKAATRGEIYLARIGMGMLCSKSRVPSAVDLLTVRWSEIFDPEQDPLLPHIRNTLCEYINGDDIFATFFHPSGDAASRELATVVFKGRYSKSVLNRRAIAVLSSIVAQVSSMPLYSPHMAIYLDTIHWLLGPEGIGLYCGPSWIEEAIRIFSFNNDLSNTNNNNNTHTYPKTTIDSIVDDDKDNSNNNNNNSLWTAWNNSLPKLFRTMEFYRADQSTTGERTNKTSTASSSGGGNGESAEAHGKEAAREKEDDELLTRWSETVVFECDVQSAWRCLKCEVNQVFQNNKTTFEHYL
eukprot:Nk52_evm16s221 gene=Nk52_evmTU16s221